MSKALPWIKIGVSVGLLGIVAYLLDWQQVKLLILETSPVDLVMALVLLLGAYLANGLRLIRLQHRVALDMPRPLFWGTYYTGLLMNYVLPSGVGGDLVRILLLSRRGYSLGPLAAAGLVDRYLGLLGLLVIAGFALLFVPDNLPLADTHSYAAGTLLLLGAALGSWWLPRFGISMLSRLGSRATGSFWDRIKRGSEFFQKLFNQPGQMVTPTLLSLVSHTLFILSYASLGHSLLPEMSLVSYFIAIPGVMLILVFPISLGGLGLREISTVGLMVWLGASQQEALTLSLLFLAVSWISVIPAILTAVHYGLGLAALREFSDAP